MYREYIRGWNFPIKKSPTFGCGTGKNLTFQEFTLYTTCAYTLHIAVTPSAADVFRLPQDHTLKLPKHNKTRGQPLPSPTTFVPLVGALLDSSRSYINIFRLFYCRTRTEISRVVLLYRFHVPLLPLLRVRRRDFLPTPSRQFGRHSLADHRTTRRVMHVQGRTKNTRIARAGRDIRTEKRTDGRKLCHSHCTEMPHFGKRVQCT